MGDLEERPGEMSIDSHLAESGETVIELGGEVDSANAPKLAEAVERVIAKTAGPLVFDLRSLRFIDSAGIAILVRAAGEVSSIRLRNPSSIVARTIEVTGLVDVLGMER